MRLDRAEIEQIAQATAPLIAEQLIRWLEDRPEVACSIPEAAAIARCDERVIRDAVERGEIRSFRAGRQVRIPRSELFGVGGKSE